MQSKNTKSKRTVKRRTSPPGCSTQKPHLFTTEEYQKIIVGACKARLQTENDILAVIKHAEELRINSLILESVLDGDVAMYAGSDGQIMFCKSNPGVHPSDGASPAVSGATRCCVSESDRKE